MEPLLETGANIELRRQSVAAWVQGNVRPVANLIANNILSIEDDEVRQEATQFEVREYQLDAWGNVWAARQSGAKSALIHLATGLGKTSVGVFDAMKFQEEFRATNGREPKILFTCHKNEILEQAAERFRAFMPSATQGFYNGDSKDKDAQVTFATLQSLYVDLDSFSPDDYDYIIDDEVHHAKADTFEQVIRYFKPTFRLGLTATPNRKDERDIRELYGDEVYSKGLPEALAEGWLATPDYHIVFDDAVKEAMQSGFEATSLRALAELFDVQPRNEIIAKNIKEEMARIGLEFGEIKTIVFCQNIEHAEEMATLLGGEAYHSDASKGERRETFDAFKNGALQVITTRDMFNEGVDVPDARLLVFLRSTSSQTVFEQQLGRGLRKHAGKERVSILDFVANIDRIAMIQELASRVRPAIQNDKPEEMGGNEDSSIDNSGVTDKSNNFGVHTVNGDFDFDKMAVDLLAKFNALKATSGYSEFVTLSNDEIVGLAIQLKSDGPLNQLEIRELSKNKAFISANTIVDRFGSLSAFQKACGFDVSENLPRFQAKELSNDDLVQLARELKPEGPLSKAEIEKLSKDRLFPSWTIINKRFGAIGEFQEACGFEMSRIAKARSLKDEDIIELAHTLKPDGPLIPSEIETLSKEDRFVSANALVRRFGSIQAFQEACGFTATEVRTANPRSGYNDFSNDELIELAKTLKPDGPLINSEIRELSKAKQFASVSIINSRFGGAVEFSRACGYDRVDTSHLQALSNEELVALSREINPNGILTQRDIKRLSAEGRFVSNSVIVDRFGSLVDFQRASGAQGIDKKSLSRQMTNEEIIQIAQDISPDKPLTAKEIGELSKAGKLMGVSALTRRFGSMAAFQEACGFEAADARTATKEKTPEDLISWARELKPEGSLTGREIDELSKQGRFVSTQAIRSRFGSIQAFREACEQ